MAWWSISLFLLSITYLTYHHPPATWEILPQWLRPAKRRLQADQAKSRRKSKGKEDTDGERRNEYTNEVEAQSLEEEEHETDEKMAPSHITEQQDMSAIAQSDKIQDSASPTSRPGIGEDVLSLPIQDEKASDKQTYNNVLPEDMDKTPQAKASAPVLDVPSFSLEVPSFSMDSPHINGAEDHDQDDEEDERDNLPRPMFPAASSAQRANKPTSTIPPPLSNPTPGLMAPPKSSPTLMAPPKPIPGLMASPTSKPASSLMPPPRGPPIRTTPSTASSLRVPSSGPVPNRGPPLSSAAQARGGLAPKSLAPPRMDTPNSRNKVQLTPGHSPLDWASLAKTRNLSNVPHFMRVTPSLLKYHNGRKDRETGLKKNAWSVYQGKVYNITPYLPFHPGGEGELLRAAGKDGTAMFNDVHSWVNWEGMLNACLVGIMVSESEEDSGLEGLD